MSRSRGASDDAFRWNRRGEMRLERGLHASATLGRHMRYSRALAAARGTTYRPASLHDDEHVPTIEPVDLAGGGNLLRPHTFDQMVGQKVLKPLLRRLVLAARTSGAPLDHMLLTGASGTGKTTTALVMACELHRRAYQVKAPVSLAVFSQLREIMHDGDVLIVDEIHQQVSGDRRGISQACDPETFFHVMEDRQLATATAMLPFPAITIIGATTDAGLLPEPFLNRFPLRPPLALYTVAELSALVHANADAFGLTLDDGVAPMLARAARGTPRVANNLVRNVKALTSGTFVREDVAREVIEALNGWTLDGLTGEMQRMLTFLLSAKRENRDGSVVYKASVNTIATALGLSRDTKAVSLYVEPYLISEGYVQVTPGGRTLTEAGILRAKELL